MRITSRGRNLAALLIVLPLLAGCSTQGAPAAAPSPVSSEAADPTDDSKVNDGTVAVAYPMPDLGPSPTPAPLSKEDREALRLASADTNWQNVVAQYPNAVRPTVEFQGYGSGETYFETLLACYEDSGVEGDRGIDADGNLAGVGFSSDNEADTVAAFACQSMHPSEPFARPTDEMLGYNYDYLTQFIVPCYEANGMANPPAPSREEFIANWPNQNWFPASPWEENWAEGHSVDDACPLLP
jgi:hypothetical protein